MNTPDDWRDEYSDEIIDDVSIWKRIDMQETESAIDKIREDIEQIAVLWEQ